MLLLYIMYSLGDTILRDYKDFFQFLSIMSEINLLVFQQAAALNESYP